MYGQDFSGLDQLFKALGVALMMSIPLAVWKIVDIALWVYRNVYIGIHPAP